MQFKSWLKKILILFEKKPQTSDELIQVMRSAEKRELLDADTLGMFEGAIQVTNMCVRDVMIPRAQMVMLSKRSTPEDVVKTVIDSTHSRFPVIGENRDEVIGILLAKDLLKYIANSSFDFDIEELARPALVVPESKQLSVMLKEFRANRNHMAVVVDEYGRTAGFITMEDVIEQIIGDIEDEFDIDEADQIKQHSDNAYYVNALTPISDFNDYFKTAFSDEEFDTIGGFVINAFGHVPKRGELISIDKFCFEIVHADSRRVRLLRMTL